MAGVSLGILWDSESRDTTVDTGTGTSGLGPTYTFLGPADPPLLWRRWSTRCRWDWSFAKRCCGTTDNSTSSAVWMKPEATGITCGGNFAVRREMESAWRLRSTVAVRVCIVFLI